MSGNLRGPVLAMRAVLPLLTSEASVVVLTTAIGQIGAPGYAGYGASKAGLNAIIRILAAEVATGIRVNGVVGPMLFLLSENARYITGQVLHVNGGALMRD